MKINLPVTSNEKSFTEGLIVTKTDLKGVITHANDLFVEISGFSRDELIGSSHNAVRHPDMPAVLFEDMWQTLKSNRPWRGLVKNRCKNGDYYWVDAFVVPSRENGTTTGYMSVRHPADRLSIAQAEALHQRLNSGAKLPRNRPRVSGATLQKFGQLLIAGVVGFFGWKVGSPSAYGISSAAILTQFFIMLYERKRVRKTTNLMGICHGIAEGKLSYNMAIGQGGEHGLLEEALACMQVNLKVMIDDLQMSAKALADGSIEVENRLQSIYRRMEAGNDRLTEMSAAIEQLSASIEQVAQHADETSQLSTDSRTAMLTSEAEMEKAQINGTQAAQAVANAQANIQSLAEAISAISSVSNAIRDIADQTNLLALNAAIEAARAGDTGRGFAVVADEVRKLSVKTGSSTEQIAKMVADVRLATEVTIATMQTVSATTQSGVTAQRETALKLVSVRETSSQVNDMMRDVATNNVQQASVAADLSAQLASVSNQISESHHHIELANKAVGNLAQQSKVMASLANRFQVVEAQHG